MKITLSKFPDNNGNEVWQVLIPGIPLCKETDKVSAETLARNMLCQQKGNELWLWDDYTKTETLLSKH